MDTVISLTAGENDQGVLMEFKEARLRTPQTADQFKPRIIARNETGWIVIGDKAAAFKGRSEIDMLRTAILDAYARLADSKEPLAGI